MKNKLRILIRADASNQIGVGHIMRDIVLAKTLKKQNFDVDFACRDLQGNLISWLQDLNYQVFTLDTNTSKELICLVKNATYDWLVLDHYKIDKNFEHSIKEQTGINILSFDDTYQSHHCDILLNHGFQAKASRYKSLVNKDTQVLCGKDYTLIKNDFYQKTYPQTKKRLHSVLITLGGTDPKEQSLPLVSFLKKINPKLHISVVTTSSNAKLSLLKQKSVSQGFTLIINTNKMAKLMAENDLIITASGGSLFEVIALNKLFINLSLASNQDEITSYLQKNKILTTLKNVNYTALKKKLSYIQKNQAFILKNITKIHFRQNLIAKEMRKIS